MKINKALEVRVVAHIRSAVDLITLLMVNDSVQRMNPKARISATIPYLLFWILSLVHLESIPERYDILTIFFLADSSLFEKSFFQIKNILYPETKSPLQFFLTYFTLCFRFHG